MTLSVEKQLRANRSARFYRALSFPPVGRVVTTAVTTAVMLSDSLFSWVHVQRINRKREYFTCMSV